MHPSDARLSDSSTILLIADATTDLSAVMDVLHAEVHVLRRADDADQQITLNPWGAHLIVYICDRDPVDTVLHYRQLQPALPMLVVVQSVRVRDVVALMRLGVCGVVEADDLSLLDELVRAELDKAGERHTNKAESNTALTMLPDTLHGLPRLILDPESGQIVDANPAAASYYGFELERLKTLRIFDLSASQQAAIQAKLQKAAHGDDSPQECVHYAAGNQLRNVEVFPSPVEIDGRQYLYAVVIDTTERVRAKAELQMVNEQLERRVAERTAELEHIRDRLEAIFNHSGDAIVLLSMDEGIQQVNETFEEMFGLSASAASGMNLSALFHAESARDLETVVQEVAASHQMRHVEASVTTPHGRETFVEISIAPVNRSDKTVTNLVCIVRDVTEHRLDQRAIAEERNLLRTVIDAVPDFIYVKDTQHRMVLNNAAHAHSLGADSPSDVIGIRDSEVFPAEMAAKFESDEVRLFQTGQAIVNTEERSIGLNGQEIWAQTTKIPRYNLQGALIGLVGITHDVSNLKRQEQTLRASEERLRLFIESAPIATVITERDGSIVVLNREAELLFGYERSELLGESVERLVPDEFRRSHPAHREQYYTSASARRLSSIQLSGRRKDGSVFPADIQLSYVAMPDNMLVIVTILDITQRKLAEAALKQALEQERDLGALKTQFISRASHEFRTPLAAILALTETLTYYRNRMTEAEISNRLDTIRGQILHMKGIMEDVLQLSRMQSNRNDFEPKLEDLDTLCRSVRDEFESQDAYRDRVRYECASAPLWAACDARLLRQVIENLLSNALKYSPKDAPVQFTLERRDADVVLTFADQGIGIPPDEIRHIFEPFHRASNVGEIVGTGLGLSIARQAVEKHRGTLTLQSEVGKGTTVTVSLPGIAS